MSNLLKETIDTLKSNGKDESNVLWVGDKDFKTTWENFKDIADVGDDNGFGSLSIAIDLIVMGDTFWLERGGYDGLEWWEYKSRDKLNPTETRKMRTVIKNGWWGSLCWDEKEEEVGMNKQSAKDLIEEEFINIMAAQFGVSENEEARGILRDIIFKGGEENGKEGE